MKNVLKGISSCFRSIKSDWSIIKKETEDIIFNFIDFSALPIILLMAGIFVFLFAVGALANWPVWVVFISVYTPFLILPIGSIFIKLSYYFKMKLKSIDNANTDTSEISNSIEHISNKNKGQDLVLEKFNIVVNLVNQIKNLKIKKKLMCQLMDILNEYKTRFNNIENAKQQPISLNIDNMVVLQADIMTKLKEFEDSMKDILQRNSFNEQIMQLEERMSDFGNEEDIVSRINVFNNNNDSKELKRLIKLK